MKTTAKFTKRHPPLPAIEASAGACWNSASAQDGGGPRFVTMTITSPDLGVLKVRMSTEEADALAAEITRSAASARAYDRDEARCDHALSKVIR